MRCFLISILCVLTLGCNDIPKGLSITENYLDDLHSKLISSPKNSNRPLIIVVPGSGGSYLPDKYLFGIVRRGYDVLSVAYVGKRGLPREIELVPLEYLKRIVSTIKKDHPSRKVVLLGISKGAEYALTFASHFDLVDGIVCYSPSSFVLPNHVNLKKDDLQKSSWALNGNEIPFATLAPFSDEAGMVTYKKYIDPIFDNPEELIKSSIMVENIKCTILLLSGEDDLVWPSTRMGNLIQSRIEQSGSKIKIEHISYENCGHQFIWFNENEPQKAPQYQSMNLTGIKKHKFLFGGTKEATIKAMMDSKERVFHFLQNLETKDSLR